MLPAKTLRLLSHLDISVVPLVAPVVLALGMGSVRAQSGGAEGIKVTTYFDTQAPPGENAPVCLTNRAEPVGRVQSVRVAPKHALYHDRWEVDLMLNAREASELRADSVVHLKLPDGHRNCGGASHTPFLEIDAGRAVSPAVTDHAVLKGEVDYFAEIDWMRPPKPWWTRLSIQGACFAVLILAVGLILLARRRKLPRG